MGTQIGFKNRRLLINVKLYATQNIHSHYLIEEKHFHLIRYIALNKTIYFFLLKALNRPVNSNFT